MKYIQLLIIVLFLSISFNASAQYDKVQLPHPDYMGSLFLGALNDSKIFYGETPPNSADRPVVVFVHGFIDLANTWFIPGNDLYESTYDDGYRTVYVATTRGKGFWTNGEILASMLEDITDFYGVDDVVLIAHSNGGKSSEVAMFEHNKHHLVDRVITLGTPFFGTELADLGETYWFKWLVDLVGIGGGTSTSTTYYMSGTARPYLDSLPNNIPSKFINLGAKGNCSGSTITAPAICIAGGYVQLAGGGINDGVTPYYSSTRPGGLTYWTGGGIPYYDHIDLTQDFIMWNEVESLIQIDMSTLRTATSTVNRFPKQEITSNLQILNSKNKTVSFVIEEGATDIQVELLYADANASFELLTSDKQPVSTNYKFNKSESYKNGQAATLMVENLEAGTYKLQGTTQQYAAIVSYNGGVALHHTSELSEDKTAYTTDETIRLNMEVLHLQTAESVDMKAFVTLKNDLKGNPINGAMLELDFVLQSDGSYALEMNNLEAGVYNVFVEAKGKTFVRNLVTGFVVENSILVPTTVELSSDLNVTPNLVQTSTTVTLEISEAQENVLSLFDVKGQLVKQINLSEYDKGVQQIDLNLEDLQSGVYFLSLHNDKGTQTERIVKF